MINICFALDHNLKDKVFNVIRSINKNTKSEIHYYFLLDKSVTYLKHIENATHKHIDIPEITSFHNTLVKSKAMFYRWLIADNFPDIDKCIYLDCDLILNTDIKRLWDIDLEGNIIGSVKGVFGHSIANTMFFQGDVSQSDMFMQYNCDVNKPSFLSGQMLIDLKKWREKNITKKLIDFVVKYKTADMIAMNIILQDDIYELDYRWNCPAKYVNEQLKSIPPNLTHQDYSDFYLCHYHGQIKPWMKNYPNKRLQKLWERYN